MLMKNTLIFSLLTFPLVALADNAPIIDKQTYDLNSINKLALSLHHATIKINHDSHTNKLTLVHKQVLKKGTADKCLYQLKAKNKKHSLTLYNENNADNQGFFNFSFSAGCSVEQDITITIGTNNLENFDAKFQHSDIEFERSESGEFNLDIGHSKMIMTSISSQASHLNLAHSYLTVNNIIAQNMEITGAHSGLEIKQLKGTTLDGDWAHGALDIEQSNIANVKLGYAHGELKLKEHQGENLYLDAAHSSIYANTTITKQAELENHHGPIEFSGMAKKLSVTNAHGEIKVTQLSDDFDISGHNQHGNIVLLLPKNSDYSYNLNSDEVLIERGHLSNNHVNLTTSHGRARITEHSFY